MKASRLLVPVSALFCLTGCGSHPTTPPLPDPLAGVQPGKVGPILIIKPPGVPRENPVFTVDAAFLGGGTQIVFAAGPVWVWDLISDKEVRQLGEPSVRARTLAVSHDGSKVLVPCDPDYSLRLTDVATGREIRKFATVFGEGTSRVAMSASGQWAVSASWGGGKNGAHLWQVDTGVRVRQFTGNLVHDVAITTDEKLVAGACGALTGGQPLQPVGCGVWVWELPTGREVAHLPNREDLMLSTAFSPDGKYLAGGGSDGIIRLWETGSWKEIRQLTGHPGTVAALAFSPDGRLLVSGGARDQERRPEKVDGSVRVWDVATGKLLHTLEGHEWEVASVAFSPDSRYVLSGGGFPQVTVRLWRLPITQ